MADYFGPEADASIARYNASPAGPEKNDIFDKEIRPVFEKLVHNLIYVYKFQNLDDIQTLKAESLAHLYEMLPKFDSNRGTKAFSYFNVVGKHWFINRSKEYKKRERNESELICDLDHENVRFNPSIVVKPFEESIIEKEFWIAFSNEMATWRDRVMKPQERKVLDGVIFLFQNSGIVSIYNRKAIYIYLREITGLQFKQIANSLKKLRELYVEFKRDFDDYHGEQEDTDV